MANWNILGAGAIGHFFAEKLLKSGQHVAFCLKPNTEARQTSFTYKGLSGQISTNMLMALPGPTAKCDFLLVTLKAPQVIPALTCLQDQIGKYCCIILMHNGMGTAEQTAQLFPDNPILLGTTANGALKVSDNYVRHTGAGITWLGPFNNKAKRYAELPSKLTALDECYWADDIREKLWLKLVINCAINPLTALHQCKNGELAGEALHPEVIKVVKELATVTQRVNLPWDYVQLQDHVDSVIHRTADNYSSMQQDHQFKRHSEIEYITGYVLKAARAYGLPVPVNTALYKQIKAREAEF